MLDTSEEIETPEGVDLVVVPAGIIVRCLAYLIDFSIRAIIFIVLAMLLGWLGDLGAGVLSIFVFLLEWLYPVVFEVFINGATPGKKLMKLRVIQEDGTPVRLSSSVIRNLLRVVDFLPLGYLAGLVTMVLSGNFRRLGDLAAETMVVYDDRVVHDASVVQEDSADVYSISEHCQRRPLPMPFKLFEQQAIIQFSQRAAGLSEARQLELANILSPIVKETNQQAVDALHEISNELIGRSSGEREAKS